MKAGVIHVSVDDSSYVTEEEEEGCLLGSYIGNDAIL